MLDQLGRALDVAGGLLDADHAGLVVQVQA